MRTGISTGPGVNRRGRVNDLAPEPEPEPAPAPAPDAEAAPVVDALGTFAGGVTVMIGVSLPSWSLVGVTARHLGCGPRGNFGRGLLRAPVERVLEHLVHRLHAHEREIGPHFLGHLA